MMPVPLSSAETLYLAHVVSSSLQEHKQHVTDTKVLKTVSMTLSDVKEEIGRTAAGVGAVVAQLDAALAHLRSGDGSNGTSSAASSGAASSSETGGGGGASGGGGGGGAAAGASGGAGGGTGGGGGGKPSSTGASARDRAADLATELGKALGAYSDVAGNATAGGKGTLCSCGWLGEYAGVCAGCVRWLKGSTE